MTLYGIQFPFMVFSSAQFTSIYGIQFLALRLPGLLSSVRVNVTTRDPGALITPQERVQQAIQWYGFGVGEIS